MFDSQAIQSEEEWGTSAPSSPHFPLQASWIFLLQPHGKANSWSNTHRSAARVNSGRINQGSRPHLSHGLATPRQERLCPKPRNPRPLTVTPKVLLFLLKTKPALSRREGAGRTAR
ncbi:Sec61g [Columba livia]|nr:Sec61g [Columba livia]